ncbi:hypothetical protein LCGC14_1878110, partial [marine sediment metagenome]
MDVLRSVQADNNQEALATQEFCRLASKQVSVGGKGELDVKIAVVLFYVGDALAMPVELIQGKTYAEINDLVRSGDVTFAFVCTNPYLQGQKDFGM